MPKKLTPPMLDMNFRAVAKACAQDPEIVAEFNTLHGLNLPCPIKVLTDALVPLDLSEDESTHAALFLAWVQRNHWKRARAAKTNREKLKRSIK